MRAGELKEWRMRLGLTQAEAAQRFLVSRVTIQNWESGATPIPVLVGKTVEQEMKRLPDFGPVILRYCDSSPVRTGTGAYTLTQLHTEEFESNEALFKRIERLWGRSDFWDPQVRDHQGEIIWNSVQIREKIKESHGPKVSEEEVQKIIAKINKIVDHAATLPIYDDRSPDEILGYDENGLPR